MFSIFGLYVYLCFGFHLLAPLRSFTTLFFHLSSAQPTSLFHLILPVGLSTYRVPPFKMRLYKICLSSYCSTYPFHFNTKLFKKVSRLAVSQSILHPLQSAFQPFYFHQNHFAQQFISMLLNAKDIFKSLTNLHSQ